MGQRSDLRITESRLMTDREQLSQFVVCFAQKEGYASLVRSFSTVSRPDILFHWSKRSSSKE
jgi:hypothetical protein